MASNQAISSAPKPLATMTKLSPFVAIYEPAKGAASSATSGDPRLILVASWMDARDLHIAKYITRYQALYPTSNILLIKFNLKHIVWQSECIKAIQPAVSYLRSQVDSGYLSESPAQPEMLVHIFSNGGVASTKALFEDYEKKTGAVFPLHTTVYDSCPGLYSYWGAYNASMAGVPKGIWRWIMAPVIHALDMYLWLMAVALKRPYNLIINANWHNNPAKTRQTNRAYIYGKADDMVEWRHVELHADQAAANGYVVRKESFEGGTHVAHVRADEGRYWRIVRETWEMATTGALKN
ncbi:hypothetical protein JX266_008470 [Neoarthrinium moseri]|nr:hypothetical protein JX266_008470 [Neoarthrinium moseri]